LRENVNVSERQAAAGQLISTGASELVQPLDAVIALARDVAAESDSHAVQLAAILREARRAREIADRLITFSDPGQADFQTLDLHELLAKLLAFREKDRQEASIRLENHLSPQPAWILGSRSQLEQAFLAVLVHAEQQAVRAADRALRVRSSLMGGRAVVEVAFTANGPVRSSDLGACAMVVDAHGGELRILEEDFCRVQVDLPLDNVASDRQQERVQLPRLTALVVEPDPGKQRQLVNALAQLGQRAVPVPGAEEALDLTQRHRFDLLLCTSRLLGSPAATRLRERARSFAFVTEPFETGVPADGIPRLRQPLREAELRQWIASVR
jgi:CheY-like chemotaxis protein